MTSLKQTQILLLFFFKSEFWILLVYLINHVKSNLKSEIEEKSQIRLFESVVEA